MNYKFLLTTFLASSCFFANAQYGAKTYAITGSSTGDYAWKNIRQVDITTGKISGDILTNAEASSPGDYVAAAAFDVRTNKLFYATMHTGELRWIDLGNTSGQINVNEQRQFISSADLTDESINITRMCIGADGNGYALTNDGDHLYRFTTDARPLVTDLGNLVDADDNKGLSIHNKCTSWGGDMIADAFGKLYLISASRNVFVIDVNTRIATFMGGITGLPGTYSTNGAVVDDNGDIIVNSSLGFQGYYKVNFPGLSATLIEGSDKTYSVSDLANSNLLLQREADASNVNKLAMTTSGSGHVYPNPTSNSVLNVSFDGLDYGKYLINITDLSGKFIMSKSVDVAAKGQVETVNVTAGLAVGLYLIKVSSVDTKTSFTEKIVIN